MGKKKFKKDQAIEKWKKESLEQKPCCSRSCYMTLDLHEVEQHFNDLEKMKNCEDNYFMVHSMIQTCYYIAASQSDQAPKSFRVPAIGKPVCLQVFCFLFQITDTTLRNIINRTNGIRSATAPQHQSRNQEGHRTINDSVKRIWISEVEEIKQQEGSCVRVAIEGQNVTTCVWLLDPTISRNNLYERIRSKVAPEPAELGLLTDLSSRGHHKNYMSRNSFDALLHSPALSHVRLTKGSVKCAICAAYINAPERKKDEEAINCAMAEHLIEQRMMRIFWQRALMTCTGRNLLEVANAKGELDLPLCIDCDLPVGVQMISIDMATSYSLPVIDSGGNPLEDLDPYRVYCWSITDHFASAHSNVLWGEEFSGTNSNSAISALHCYFSRIASDRLKNARHLALFSDMMVEQHKNHALYSYLLSRVLHGHHSTITWNFMHRGHEPYTPDLVNESTRQRLKKKTLYTVPELTEAMRTEENEADSGFSVDAYCLAKHELMDWNNFAEANFQPASCTLKNVRQIRIANSINDQGGSLGMLVQYRPLFSGPWIEVPCNNTLIAWERVALLQPLGLSVSRTNCIRTNLFPIIPQIYHDYWNHLISHNNNGSAQSHQSADLLPSSEATPNNSTTILQLNPNTQNNVAMIASLQMAPDTPIVSAKKRKRQ